VDEEAECVGGGRGSGEEGVRGVCYGVRHCNADNWMQRLVNGGRRGYEYSRAIRGLNTRTDENTPLISEQIK
jgi:hypothetical protein